jgi:putative ABC transport system permease protein
VLVAGIAITPDSFAVLPFKPLLGRTLRADDVRTAGSAAAVIRESLWRRHFSADPTLIGRRVDFSGVQRVIVGVMPDEFEFPNSPEVWMPLSDFRDARLFGVLIEPDALPLAQQQISAVSRQFEEAHPEAPPVRLHMLGFVEAQSQGLDILAAAVVFVLVLVLVVIAANVANLVLARTLARSGELAVRSALGASRTRLVAQVFTETLVLGVIAAAIGVTASRQILHWIEQTLTDMPFWVTFDTTVATTLFVTLITTIAAAIGGAWPALRATRPDTMQALAASNRRVSGGLGAAASMMIALQIALSIAALHAALVVARGVSGYMKGADTPQESQIITARLYFPDDTAPPRITALVDAVAQVPGVNAAAVATSLPRLSPPARMARVRAGHGSAASPPRPAPVVAISPGFVATLGARPLVGREFTSADMRPNAAPIALVNEPFVAKFFGGVNPVGQQVQIVERSEDRTSAGWREIVGVVPDLGLSAGDEQLAAGIYVPIAEESLMYLAARVNGDPLDAGRMLPRTVATVDPRVQVRDIVRLPDVGSEDRAVFAAIGAALTSLGTIALALSVMGVYAMLSFAVTARTREIAIRSALGATRAQVLRTVLGRAAIPLLVGVGVGPAVGSLLVSARGIFAFRLPAEAGPWAVPALAMTIGLAALVAAFTPARRALAINTADALRAD